MSDTISADSVKAQMPHPTLTCIKGERTHKQVKLVIQELTANLMAVSCPWGHEKGHLGLLEDPTIYLACNGAQFNISTAEPPAYPIVPTRATTPQRKELRATNAAAPKAWTPIAWSSPSHATSLPPPLMTSTMLYWTIQSKASMALICVRHTHPDNVCPDQPARPG
jgi:hypothetical protein